jgi:lysophospholipase L1-like esterase
MDQGDITLRITRVTGLAFALLFGIALVAAPVHHRNKKRMIPPKPLAMSVCGLFNARAIMPFFTALGRLEAPDPNGVVRVLQFGDSHTSADFWSGRVRQRLQTRFGDGGPGLILPAKPWRGYPHDGVRLLSGQTWPATSLRQAECDGWVGLAGAGLSPVAQAPFKLQASFAEFNVHVLGREGDGVDASVVPIVAESVLEEGTSSLEPPRIKLPAAFVGSFPEGKSLQILTGKAPGAALQELSLGLPEGARLLGVDLLSGRPGIVYDELGLNGAELLNLERWNPILRRALLHQIHPDLLVLAYGTNDMGLSTADRLDYRARVQALLLALKEESGAPILVVGPLDRLGRKKRQRATLKEGAEWIIQTLQEVSLATGCAFWDARRAMGGYGSIQKWRQAGFAQKDLVHLNGRGYQRLGDQMADALLGALAKISER